jgi:hypothetical protein
VLASALARLQDSSTLFTGGHHAELGLPIPHERIPILMALYGGALFALVTAPPENIDRGVVQEIVRAILHGALPALKGSSEGPEHGQQLNQPGRYVVHGGSDYFGAEWEHEIIIGPGIRSGRARDATWLGPVPWRGHLAAARPRRGRAARGCHGEQERTDECQAPHATFVVELGRSAPTLV